MKKRFLSMLLVIVMLVGMMPAIGITAGAAEPKAANTDSKSIDLYLIAGQSNASGSSRITDAETAYKLAPELETGFSNVLYAGKPGLTSTYNTTWVPTKLGMGYSTATIGAEAGMAIALSEYYNAETGRMAGILKYAHGGSSLSGNDTNTDANWVTPSYAAANGWKYGEAHCGGHYIEFLRVFREKITALIDAGYTDINLKGIYWMQGEADRIDVNPNNTATYYGAALKYLISDLRADLTGIMNELYSGDAGATDLPFFIGAISESFGLTNANVINTNRKFIELQKQIAAEVPNCYFIDNARYKLSRYDSDTNSAVVLGSDTYHWNQADMLDMGQTVGYDMYSLGVIPTEYQSATEYPFVIFNEGAFVGAADTWSAANRLAREALDAANGATLTVAMRKNVTADAVDAENAISNMNGTVVLDLGGNTLTGSSAAIFNATTAGYNGGFDTVYKVQNGTVVAASGGIFSAESASGSAKKLNVFFDNVKMDIAEAGSGMFLAKSDSADEGAFDISLTLNLCVMELYGLTSNYTVFDFASSDNASVTVYFNGGDIDADETLDNAILYNGDSNDALIFDKGTTGKNTVLRVPYSYTPPAIGGLNDIGDPVVFGNGVKESDTMVYSIPEPERKTEYGLIPKEYADTNAYPFAVFSNGEFVAVYSKLIDNAGNTTDEGTSYNGCYGINSAFEMARALVYCVGGNAQIVMRSDYTNTAAYNNISHFDGEIIIDLGGHILTNNNSNPLFSIEAKPSWNGAAVILPSDITLKNGTLKTKPGLVRFHTNATENYTKDYLEGKHKVVSCTFEDLNVIYTGTEYPALIAYPWNMAGNTLKQADFNITLNNCTLDASSVTSLSVPLVVGTDYDQSQSLNDVNVAVNGGKIITKTAKILAGSFNTVDGESGDSLTFGKYDDTYTDFEGTPKLESSKIIFREEFIGSVNTEPGKVVAANGLFIQMGGGSTYTIERNTLKYTKRVGSDFVDLQFFHNAIAKNIDDDFVLSVWLKPDTANLSINDWAYRYYVNGSGTWVKIPFKISNGCYVVNGAAYSNAKLTANQWALIEIVFHYDATATSATGEIGAFTSYSFMLNGNVIATCAAPSFTHKVNHFRVLQYANATYAIDDLTVVKGTESLIDMPTTVPSEPVFREEFSGNVNTQPGGTAAADGLFVQMGNGSTYTIENNTFKYTKRVANDFVDLQFFHNACKKELDRDFVLSVWIKPDTNDLTITTWSYRNYVNGSGSWISIPFKIYSGCYVVNGTTYSDAKLTADQWALVEIAYHYDRTAVSATGEIGAFTSYSFMLNGNVIASCAAPAFAHRINHFRFLQYATATYSMDDLTVATGAGSLINEPNTLPAEVIFREEFTESVNTDPNKVVAANGLLAQMGDGSTYTLENNTLKYTTRVARDYIDLQFFHSAIAKNLDRSFVLSFWIKPDTDNLSINVWTYRYYVNGSGTWITIPFKITNGCYVINGTTYSAAKLNANEWALMEIVFNYDSYATSATGETGAFTSYSFMLNGEVIATCAAPSLAHKINHFRFLQYANATYAIDDLTVAMGTGSLIDTISSAPTEICNHVYDNACDKDCNKCGEIREIEHNYNAVITNPTCVNGGFTTFTCSVCGDSYTDNVTDALGHSYGMVENAPTCEDKGSKVYTCPVCGDSYVDNKVDALGHVYDNEFDADCNVCGEIREVASPAEGTCGTTSTWRYEDGVLYIEGSGSMNAYSSKNMPWIKYKNEITTVIVAEGIRSIGKCSFYEYTNLTSVTLPSTLRTINAYAFYGCSGLIEITLPASLTAIKQYAFRRSGLTSATFENDCGWSAGENKLAAAELSFAHGAALHLVKYGFKADWTRDVNAAPEVYNLIAMGYCGTNAWWTLDDEGTLSILGSGVVINCTSKEAPWTAYKNEITKVVIGEGITKLGKSAFYEYANITEVILPSTLTEIGHYAFYGCKGLTEVTIPASVTTIGSYVFRKSGVTSVIFENTEGWSYRENAVDVTDAANVAYLLNKVSYSNIWSK